MVLSRLTTAALAPVLRPLLPRLAIATLAAALSGLAALCALWCLVQFIADLTTNWILAALGLWIAAAVLTSFASWLAHDTEAKFAARLRRRAANHLVRLPAGALARHSGDVLRRLVSDDIAALHHMIAHLPAEISTFVIVPLASIALLLAIAGPIALLALLPGVIAALYYLVLMPRLSARHGAERMKVMSEIVTAVDDYARGIRVNRIYGTQSGALAAYRNATTRFTQGMVAWVRKVATPAALAVALMQAATTFAIAYAVAYRQDTSILAATLFFSLAIVTPALKLGHGLDYVAAGRAAAKRIATLLLEPTLPAGNASLPAAPLSIEAAHAVLAVADRRILDGLSYRFMPGMLTAITGASGSGKTTLLRALAGLEPLQGGHIFLAQCDIAPLDEQTRHDAVLLLPQGGDVLPASVRENLALSSPEATDEQYIDALRQAQITLDLDTDTGQLSGGERQRVGLARAFLSHAPVLLLDEPTSALDAATAKRLIEALHTLAHRQQKTVVVVTHDPALAAGADALLALTPATHEGALV
ncbi:ABC transporter [Serratia marcescens]|uniref:ABC transporter n=1 Tax=Serratia marcescens TaxID=615 RepID=A0A1Q4NXS9_SERMA|nr:ABC transporter ATP-binding protein [Serratia marcescens]OKB65669.1 ABC transporter [Serratia marcescens]